MVGKNELPQLNLSQIVDRNVYLPSDSHKIGYRRPHLSLIGSGLSPPLYLNLEAWEGMTSSMT